MDRLVYLECNRDVHVDPTTLLPTLWIGTTLGSVLTMMISLPEADLRHTQPVVVSTSGELHALLSFTLCRLSINTFIATH